jgi:hypothetical protein
LGASRNRGHGSDREELTTVNPCRIRRSSSSGGIGHHFGNQMTTLEETSFCRYLGCLPSPFIQKLVWQGLEADGIESRASDVSSHKLMHQLGFLEARHRAHARVEHRIRVAKVTGLGRFPSREYSINQVWIQIAAIAADLSAWLQLIAIHGDLATAEPKTLRFRMLHVPARLTRVLSCNSWINSQSTSIPSDLGVSRVGPVGLEPTTRGLKVRCSAN